jgi:hypothetical protein
MNAVANAQEAAPARFTKISADGQALAIDAAEWAAVLDSKTGLMWTVEEISRRLTQPKAVEHAQALNTAGFNDWQLPTREQLLTLVDDTKYDPAIDTQFFPNCKPNWYWTRTPAAYSPGYCAWGVNFDNGLAHWGYHGNYGFVRAVRVGQSLGSSVSAAGAR